MTLPAARLLSPEEYLTLDRAAEAKSEYFHGTMFAMAGGSPAHNRIAANLIREVDALLLDGPCVTYTGDQRIRVDETGLYTYPDLVVVCGEAIFEGGETLLNPVLVVEVLSPGTEAYDRGAKFAHYRRIPSLQEYLLVAQDRPRIERLVREGADWKLTEFDGLPATLELRSVPVQVPLARVYDRVGFPQDGVR